jgi:DNA-binding helix-hairpin-helix protein with protein kinase domain
VPLERQLASGGEGAVFTLQGAPDRVAKLYHHPPTTQTVTKLQAMVRLGNPRLLKLAAWPLDLLYQARTRQVSGFLMPKVSDCQPIQQLYNPVQRLSSFPRAGWRFQVRAASNLAAAFDEVHKAGCLVGDVNQSNALVSPQALVRLIDCDSFQVRVNGSNYLCEVGVAHYTPPELQGKNFRGVVRTTNHDRFGLAVLIYQLLFVGRHPYAGVYRGPGDPPFEQLIAEFRFAQGPAARAWQMDPPPHTPTLDDVPPEVAGLFRRAFERGSESGTRPQPADWLAALGRLEQEMFTCRADPGHTYWRGAVSCPWCRLAQRGGPEYYYGVGGAAAGTFVADEAKLQEIVRRLRAAAAHEFPYERSRFSPPCEPQPEPPPAGLQQHWATAGTLGAALGACVVLAAMVVFHRAFCCGGTIGILLFGTWLVLHLALSPWHRERHRRQAARRHALADLEDVEREWRHRVSDYARESAGHSQRAERLVSEYRELPKRFQAELQRLRASAEEMARLRHLRLHQIADADIPKIGTGRIQILASYGISTAADLEPRRVQAVKGFGKVLAGNLFAWKIQVLATFRFNPAAGVPPGEQRQLVAKFQGRQAALFAELGRYVAHMESLAATCQGSLQRLVPELRERVAHYEEAVVNCAVFDS